ncbi:aspartate ammonia-lyase [Bacteriovorax sp. BSW11_IV]|uniref:aspartate ammonia-lyase n=1 Tax=Bacteriovorax sp. BSW11_IV TaxID=1353529 RepID=UPI00038A560C|nr:aspartate ammonia-lyase [Bacteriovorax sp. BSW11_IV]EQC48545.1 aspartate ammonia-lyase [Bacteriovorax sp. BSW11_IV]
MTRIEHDLLGEKEIPKNAYYGIHTLRAMENFNITPSCIGDYPIFVRGMVMTKKASALANMELGTIPEDKAAMIIKACDELLENGEKYYSSFKTDIFQGGAGTSVNMNTNEVIANIALELYGHEKGQYNILDPNDHVNKCQSTNDAYPTGFRVALYFKMGLLIEELEKLVESFSLKGKEFAAVLKMGRTQLQDAVPMSLGQEFEAFAVTMKEEIKTLKMSQELILEVNLGATAIGTGINAPKEYSALAIKHLAKIAGAHFVPAENLVEATSDTGAYVMMSGTVKRAAVKISKICNDLRLLSSGPRAGLNEINLPEMQAGSSIMPAKVNPVIPEVVNQIAFKIIGNDITVTMAAEAGQLQLNVMEPVLASSLFESLHLLTRGFWTLREKCVNGITANSEVCYNNVMNSIGIVTFLNPYIGHHNGDRVGKICATTGKTVKQVVLEEGLMSEEELDKIFTVENMINPQYMAKRFK